MSTWLVLQPGLAYTGSIFHETKGYILPVWCYASMVYGMAQCLSVCLPQATVLSKWLNRSSWFVTQRLPSLTYPALCYKGIIRVFLSGKLSQTLNLVNFSAFSPRHVDSRQWRQLSSTITSLSHWASTFVYSTMRAMLCIARFICESWVLLMTACCCDVTGTNGKMKNTSLDCSR